MGGTSSGTDEYTKIMGYSFDTPQLGIRAQVQRLCHQLYAVRKAEQISKSAAPCVECVLFAGVQVNQ